MEDRPVVEVRVFHSVPRLHQSPQVGGLLDSHPVPDQSGSGSIKIKFISSESAGNVSQQESTGSV